MTDEELEAAVQTSISLGQGQEAFNQWLADNNMTMDEFRARNVGQPLFTGQLIHTFELWLEEVSFEEVVWALRRERGRRVLANYGLDPRLGKYHRTFCPTCQAIQKTTECEIYSRVVGYIRPVNQWNKGKQQEFHDRTTFDLKEKLLVTT
jgi:hypothetical protein